MSGLAQLEERIAKLEAAAADIRDATREAHEAIQTLRVLKRDLAEYVNREAPQVFDDMIQAHISTLLEQYGDKIGEAQRRAVEQVGRTFDELARIYLEGSGGKHRDIPLPTLAERARRGAN